MNELAKNKVTFFDRDLREIAKVKGATKITHPREGRFMRVENTLDGVPMVEDHIFGNRRVLLHIIEGIIKNPPINTQSFADALKAAKAALKISNHPGIFDVNLVTLKVKELVAKAKGQANAEASPLPASASSDPAQSTALGSHSGFRPIGESDDWDGDEGPTRLYTGPKSA